MRKVIVCCLSLAIAASLCACTVDVHVSEAPQAGMNEETDAGMSEEKDAGTGAESSVGMNEEQATEVLETEPMSIEYEDKFGSVYGQDTIEEFIARGFEFGDSLDVEFSNGKHFEDIPFYSGYFTRNGEMLLVGYQGYPHICFASNNGDGMREILNADEDTDTMVVRLHEKAKYIDIQNAMAMTYSSERSDFSSDAEFANFREVKVGGLASGRMYRSASPCDDSYHRAPYVNDLCEENGISFIMDLADNEDDIQAHLQNDTLNNTYWRNLYEQGSVCAMGMSTAYYTDKNKQKLADGIRALLASDGPFLVHCTEGKDRTGFICLLLESLAGASLDELEADYMETYDNYFGITEETNPVSYDAYLSLKLGDMYRLLLQQDDISDVTGEELTQGVRDYLMSTGLSEDEVDKLKERLCD